MAYIAQLGDFRINGQMTQERYTQLQCDLFGVAGAKSVVALTIVGADEETRKAATLSPNNIIQEHLRRLEAALALRPSQRTR